MSFISLVSQAACKINPRVVMLHNGVQANRLMQVDNHLLSENCATKYSHYRQVHTTRSIYSQNSDEKSSATNIESKPSGWLDRMFSNRIETGNEPHSRLL